MNENLLTVDDVAKYLQISPRTVYDNARTLGGFYPFGIGVLRFKREVIYGTIQRQGLQVLDLQVPVPGKVLRGQGIQYAAGSSHGRNKTPRGNQGGIKTDPARHGL